MSRQYQYHSSILDTANAKACGVNYHFRILERCEVTSKFYFGGSGAYSRRSNSRAAIHRRFIGYLDRGFPLFADPDRTNAATFGVRTGRPNSPLARAARRFSSSANVGSGASGSRITGPTRPVTPRRPERCTTLSAWSCRTDPRTTGWAKSGPRGYASTTRRRTFVRPGRARSRVLRRSTHRRRRRPTPRARR